MIIDYTEEELKRREELRAELKEAIRKQPKGKAEVLTVRYSYQLRLFDKICQKRHFDELNNDPQRILEDAERQIDRTISWLYEILQASNNNNPEDFARIGETIDGEFKLNGNMTADIARHHLYLHFEAFKDNEELSQQLYSLIVTAVRDSEYTTDIDISQFTKELEGGAPDAIKEILERDPLAIIKKLGIMADKVNTQLIVTDAFTEAIDGQLVLKWAVNQGKQNQEPVPIYLSLTYEGENLIIKKKMTAYDKAVYEAIATAFYYHRKNGNTKPLCITPQEIWRIMAGLANTKKTPSPNQTAAVMASVDKMRFTRVFMDISKEINEHHLSFEDERVTKGTIDTYLLAGDAGTFKTDKGMVLTGYRFLDMPILYSYNAAKGRLILTPYELLDTSEETGNEGNTIVFRNYLLQEIGKMKKGKRNSTHILFDTIYENTGVENPKERVRNRLIEQKAEKTEPSLATIRKERKKDSDKIMKLLNVWKEKKWIIDFKAIKKGQTISGVDIILGNKKTKVIEQQPDN